MDAPGFALAPTFYERHRHFTRARGDFADNAVAYVAPELTGASG